LLYLLLMFARLLFASFGIAFASAAGCADRPEVAAAVAPVSSDAARVLVVMNEQSKDSLEVGRHYVERRGIPKANVVLVQTPETENLDPEVFQSEVVAKVRKAITASKTRIDFIVLTKGLPFRLKNDGGYSLDAHLAVMDLPIKAIEKPEEAQIRAALSPYFGKSEPFNSATYGFFLVTRLDGYTVADAKRLVDNSVAAKPAAGLFYFDFCSHKTQGGFGIYHESLKRAHAVLDTKGYQTRLEGGESFLAPPEALAGYASWGSNDHKFDEAAYRRLRFVPGALAETFVSTSARTFARTTGGQSLIADLIENGVTGVKGYVSEPYTFALARPDILFDRYTGGFNLAESFYMASPILKWKDVVIGDPLCSPYARG
jgi:uncharacterized protein (TIGR03790 family)